jgi:hypothetical protein
MENSMASHTPHENREGYFFTNRNAGLVCYNEVNESKKVTASQGDAVIVEMMGYRRRRDSQSSIAAIMAVMLSINQSIPAPPFALN